MEQLLHYIWKHKLFPLESLHTTTGELVEVIDTGLHNHHAGPDFFNAKIKIGGVLWVGNVEIHQKSADWYQHGHDHDPAYDNVVLHITGNPDVEVVTSSGRRLPQLLLTVPQHVRDNYQTLLHADCHPPCHEIVAELSPLRVHSWLSALQTERLEQKTETISSLLKTCGGSWDAVFFITLARSFGFGVNSEAFDVWARNVPLMSVAHHRDDIFQVEAIFLGQAGLLEPDSLPKSHRQEAMEDGYFSKLRKEYLYLSHKFSMKPIDATLWRFLRLRPQNFPYIRLSQLANLYAKQQVTFDGLLRCETLDEASRLLETQATPYWQSHYVFGSVTTQGARALSRQSLNLLLLNAVVPLLFAYGRYRHEEQLCDRAFDFLEQLPAEKNHVVSLWEKCGIHAQSAGDSQAMLQLQLRYCDRKDCLRCRFGYEYLKGKRTVASQ